MKIYEATSNYRHSRSTYSKRHPARQHQKRRRQKKSFVRRTATLIIGCILIIAALNMKDLFHTALTSVPFIGEEKLEGYAAEHGLSLSDYPKELIELYKRNPETKTFVFEYPFAKDNPPAVDLSGTDTSSVPLFLQWDQRWGYDQYAGDLFGLSGCGPTCLSMVAVYLTKDTSMDPGWMGEFATSHGYASDGSGSFWTLFSEGGRELGFDVTEIPLDEQRIINNLQVGNPIVAVMGPGDFTSSGHFIVFSGYEDGKLKVNDPNSKANSEKLWDFSKIQGQIKDLWVFRNK